MPVNIYKQTLVDELIDGKTIQRNDLNRMYLPYYISKMGSVTVSAGASYVDVTDEDVDENYIVLIEPSWLTTWSISNKTASGFRINFGTAPASDSQVKWVKVRQA